MPNPTRSDERGRTPGNGPGRSVPVPTRCRSFCFLERGGERWGVFLVTHPDGEGRWRGHFMFRPSSAESEEEIRTASLFVEASEGEVDARARGLGYPLLLALLESALDTHERRRGLSPDARRWFRRLLAEHAAELTSHIGPPPEEYSLPHLRSLYDSYRLDQVAHLIALLDPAEFRALVDRLLDGRTIDFRARDRLQLAMIVVQELERRLPLPPFEAWAQDYLAHPEAYRVYSHALHRGEELP